MALDITLASDITVAFVTSLFALLMSSPVMWRKEHLWNFRVLQTLFSMIYAKEMYGMKLNGMLVALVCLHALLTKHCQ
jgi:hypothetical protein